MWGGWAPAGAQPLRRLAACGENSLLRRDGQRVTCYLAGRQVTQHTISPVVTQELLTAHPKDEVFQS